MGKGWTALGCLVLMLVGCKAAEPPVMAKAPAPHFRDGVRQEPLTTEEVSRAIQAQSGRIEACYRGEAMNSARLSAFVIRLGVPTNGSPPTVQLKSATIPGQQVLGDCVMTVLRSLRFPAHSGARLEIDVPIERAGG